MSRRKLTPEERELWLRVAATARATGHNRPIPDETEPFSALHPPSVAPPRAELPTFRIGDAAPAPKTRIDLAPGPGATLAGHPVQMDRKAHKAMTRGKLAPEATLDLHGMTLAEAHPELVRFILNAQTGGRRLVLVITGKGKRGEDHGPIPQRVGVLRHQVPHWLRLPPLAPAILQVSEAHLKHGGAGAYYVYLRRNR